MHPAHTCMWWVLVSVAASERLPGRGDQLDVDLCGEKKNLQLFDRGSTGDLHAGGILRSHLGRGILPAGKMAKYYMIGLLVVAGAFGRQIVVHPDARAMQLDTDGARKRGEICSYSLPQLRRIVSRCPPEYWRAAYLLNVVSKSSSRHFACFRCTPTLRISRECVLIGTDHNAGQGDASAAARRSSLQAAKAPWHSYDRPGLH